MSMDKEKEVLDVWKRFLIGIALLFLLYAFIVSKKGYKYRKLAAAVKHNRILDVNLTKKEMSPDADKKRGMDLATRVAIWTLVLSIFIFIISLYLSHRDSVQNQINELENWKLEFEENLKITTADPTFKDISFRESHFSMVLENAKKMASNGNIKTRELRQTFIDVLFEFQQIEDWINAANNPVWNLADFSYYTARKPLLLEPAIEDLKELNESRINITNNVDKYISCLKLNKKFWLFPGCTD